MRHCSFTRFVARCSETSTDLGRHLANCEACRIAAELVHGSADDTDRTLECPSGNTLDEYAMDRLGAAQAQTVNDHVLTCGYCTQRVASRADLSTSEENVAMELERANREIDACLLATEIATWLSTEEFPRERESVIAGIDDALEEQRVPEPNLEKDLATVLGFDRAGAPSPAQQILGVAVAVAQMVRGESPDRQTVARLLEEKAYAFAACGIAGRVVRAAINRLRTSDPPPSS